MSKFFCAKSFFAIAFFLFSSQIVFGQYVITGRVTDASNGDPVPFANVTLKGVNIGTTTNFDGIYTLKSKVLADSIFITFVGFKTRYKAVDKTAANQTINAQLEPASRALEEIIVRSGENPAYKVLRGVIDNREKNDRKRLTAYEYDSYSKMELDVDNLSEKLRAKKFMKQIQGAIDKFEKIAGEDGKPVIPTFISETISKFYFRETPGRRKEMILKTNVKGVGVKDGGFISQLIGGNLFANYNFYDNYVPFLGKDFASPIGENWKGNYKLFLSDTTEIDGKPCYTIEFDPKRPQDLVFTGKMWIDTTNFALVEMDATIGSGANLNYIEKIKIQQQLEQTSEGAWLPSKTRFLIDLKELTKNSAGMLAKFYISNKNFVVNKPKDLGFYDLPAEVAEDAKEEDPTFWDKARHDPLSIQDRLAMKLVDTVMNVPIVRTYVDIAEIVASGWKKYNGIEFGPYINAFAVNRVEGLRLRLGFRTNAKFSKDWVFRGFLGYGTGDGRIKYGGEVNYILSKRHWTVAGARHSFDLERVGLTPEIVGDNKIFAAFTRWGRYTGAFFRNENEVFFKTEPTKGIMLTASLTTRSFDPLFRFQFRENPELGSQSPVQDHFNETFLTFETRFAKNETYIMDGNERITLGTKRIPVVSLKYQYGMRGVLNGDFNYHRFTLRAYQTFRLGTLGRSNYTLMMGYTPSNVPAPLLFPHLGNETFFFNRTAFNMMNYFEFVSDRYVSLQFNHNFEGFLFNRIPLIRQLKWRLVGTANVLWGSQREENRELMREGKPLVSRYLDQFPFDSLDPQKPYVEVGYGIDNIFKIIRVQAFHRLNYLDHRLPLDPRKPLEGDNVVQPKGFSIKASVHFAF